MLIDIPLELPTLNEYWGANNRSRWAGAGMKKRAEKAILEHLRNVSPAEIPQGKRLFVKITWTRKNARNDPDNISFAKKFVLDAMVTAGIIPNDSQKYIAGFYDLFTVGSPNVRIELIPV